MQWLAEAIDRLERGENVVLVTVAGTRGSAPRPAGAKLLVSGDAQLGSVGGGASEQRAVARARALLARGQRRRREILDSDPAADKCCGGALELVFERLEAADQAALEDCRRYLADEGAILSTPLDDAQAPKRAYALAAAPAALLEALVEPATAALVELPADGLRLVERLQDQRRRVWLFGAGHVGRALTRALEPLPFHLTWVDDRRELLPSAESDALRPLYSPTPALEVARIPAGAFVLIMSHSHGLDFEIAEAALRRDDLGFVGLIGSAAKKAQFVRRCRAHGLAEVVLERLVSPIGLPTIRGREPAVIAASVAAQLLQTAEAVVRPEDARRPTTQSIISAPAAG